MGALNLTEDDFFADEETQGKTKDAVMDRVLGEDFAGFLIDAPESVRTDKRESYPLVGYHVATMKEMRETGGAEKALLAMTDLATNRVKVKWALDSGKNPLRSGSTPDPDEAVTTVVDMFSADLRGPAALKWESGKHALSLLLRDRISNTIQIEVAAPLPYGDPEVIAFIEEQRRGAVPPPQPVWPPLPLEGSEAQIPSYAPAPEAPEPPAKAGIALPERVIVVDRPGATCVVRGSFRLPVLERERVVPRGEPAELPDVGDPEAKAVVPITLVATGHEQQGPWIFRLQIPVHEAVEAGHEATGQFAVDLFALPSMPHAPMTYYVYAFNGVHATGPLLVSVLSESMLAS